MHDLIEKMMVAGSSSEQLKARHDGAVLDIGKAGRRIAFTTDSYVVKPLFFPGGDIGSLSVYGTANDLAMCGARPKFLSVGLVLEEGFSMETLWRVVSSMREAAARIGMELVTGDTKVVDRGRGDGVFINTAGIGICGHDLVIAPASVRSGDAIILSGDVGRHGMAVMAARENLEFERSLESDAAPVFEPVLEMLSEGIGVHCLRDLTRGGLASALVEIAEAAGIGIRIEEESVPVREDVRGACEILGLDPVYVANEGRFAAFVPEREAGRALDILRGYPVSAGACIIGRAREEEAGMVEMCTSVGSARALEMLSGEQLPRIC